MDLIYGVVDFFRSRSMISELKDNFKREKEKNPEWIPKRRTLEDKYYEDKEFAKLLLDINVEEFHLLSEELKNDPEIVNYTYPLLLSEDPKSEGRWRDYYHQNDIKLKEYSPILYFYYKIFYEMIGKSLKIDKKFFINFIKNLEYNYGNNHYYLYKLGMDSSLLSDFDIISEICTKFHYGDDKMFMFVCENNLQDKIRNMMVQGYDINQYKSNICIRYDQYHSCYESGEGSFYCRCPKKCFTEYMNTYIFIPYKETDTSNETQWRLCLTPFQYVCARNLKSVLFYLYSNGGDPELKEKSGKNAIKLMEMFGSSSTFLYSLISFPKKIMEIQFRDITFIFH